MKLDQGNLATLKIAPVDGRRGHQVKEQANRLIIIQGEKWFVCVSTFVEHINIVEIAHVLILPQPALPLIVQSDHARAHHNEHCSVRNTRPMRHDVFHPASSRPACHNASKKTGYAVEPQTMERAFAS